MLMLLLSAPVEITNWPSYTINLTEFIFTNLLPIFITGIFTLFITYTYDKFKRKREDNEKNMELLTSLILKYDSALIYYKNLALNYKGSFSTITATPDYNNEFIPISMDLQNTDIYIQIVLRKLVKISKKTNKQFFNDFSLRFDKLAELTKKSTDTMYKSVLNNNLGLFIDAIDSIPFSEIEDLTNKFLEFRTR